MFRRRNLKWTLPALVAVLLAAGMAVMVFDSRPASALSGPASGAVTVAQAVAAAVPAATEPSPPAGLTVEGLVGQMQGRADAVGGLEGVIGVQMTLPAEGPWKGMPFKYKSPDAFIELTGTQLESPDGAPVSEENAWRLFSGGKEYARSGGQSMELAAGRDYKGLSYGDDPQTLLLANLMPSAWFGAFTKDLKVGPDETVDGVTYHVLVDWETLPPPGQTFIRYMHNNEKLLARQTRRAHKYYVNAQTLLCDRMVLAARVLEWPGWQNDPFQGATMDVVASDVQAVGGGQLAMTYTKRYYGTTGVYQAQALTLHGVAGKGPAGFAAGAFDPLALTPGNKPVLLRPMARIEDLEKLAQTKPDDPGLYLTLADGYMQEEDYGPAQKALQKADALGVDGDYAATRGAVWQALEPKLVARDLVEEPQQEEIFTERAARFRSLGDDVHAADMQVKAAQHASALAQTQARGQALGVQVQQTTGGTN